MRLARGLHHGGKLRLALAGQRDDLTHLQRAEDLDGFGVAAVQVVAAGLLLLLRQISAQLGVLDQLGGRVVARRSKGGDVTLELGAQRAHFLLETLDVAHLADDGAVRLELREGLLDQADGIVEAIHGQHVDGHVVAGLELGNQRIRACGRQPRHLVRVHRGRPLHHGVADVVDATPASAPRELGVLARGEVHVRFAVELDHLLQHNGARRHIDAQRQGLGGENDLD